MKSLPPLSSSTIRHIDEEASAHHKSIIVRTVQNDLPSSPKESGSINTEGVTVVIQRRRKADQQRDEVESIETIRRHNPDVTETHLQLLGIGGGGGVNGDDGDDDDAVVFTTDTIRRVDSENSLLFPSLDDESSSACHCDKFSSGDSLAYSYSSSSDNDEDDDDDDEEEDEPYDARLAGQSIRMEEYVPRQITVWNSNQTMTSRHLKEDRSLFSNKSMSVRGQSSSEDNWTVRSSSWRDLLSKRKLTNNNNDYFDDNIGNDGNDDDDDDDSLGPGRIVPSNISRRRWMAFRSGRQ